MWILLGVFVLLGGQPSEAGTGDHAQHTDQRAVRAERTGTIDKYVALGDSYTAGSGIPPTSRTGCQRSERNYPQRIAARLGATLVDVSCGGANTFHSDTAQQTDTGTVPPQLRAVGRAADLVTISLGINDAGFAALLYQCLAVAPDDPLGAPCRASFQTAQGDVNFNKLPEVRRQLERIIGLVAKQAPHARIVVVGYPQLVPPTGTCAALPFATGDYAYVREFFDRVNDTQRLAARHTGADYVDMAVASVGHDACAGDEAWLNGVDNNARGITFHPYANEQRAVAALVADLLE